MAVKWKWTANLFTSDHPQRAAGCVCSAQQSAHRPVICLLSGHQRRDPPTKQVDLLDGFHTSERGLKIFFFIKGNIYSMFSFDKHKKNQLGVNNLFGKLEEVFAISYLGVSLVTDLVVSIFNITKIWSNQHLKCLKKNNFMYIVTANMLTEFSPFVFISKKKTKKC